MSDLNYNPMSREEMIKAARANCIRQIDSPGRRSVSSEELPRREGGRIGISKGTYVRLFCACLLFLGVFFGKYYNFSYKGYDYKYIQTVIQSEDDFEQFKQQTAHFMEEKIIPVFHRLDLESLL